MTRRRFQWIACVLAVFFMMPWPAAAKKVEDVETASRFAQAFGGKVQPELMTNALRSVGKTQLHRYKRDVTLEKPLDVRVLGDRYMSAAFSARVKKAGSARAKAEPAIYVLLFQKKADGGLDHQMQHLMILADPGEIASYETMADAEVAARFRKAGADVKVVAAAPVPKPDTPEPVALLSGDSICRGVVGESFIDDSITRDSELMQLLSGYARKEDIPKAVPVVKAGAGSPELQLRVAELEARVRALEGLLANITRKGGNIYFNGVNLYVTNGTGKADKVNGKGNVVIGYGATGSGSHNLVVGAANRFEGFGSVVSGRGNAVSGNCSAVLGGESNKASGDFSIVAGGKGNKARGTYASILGGTKNTAKGEYTSINGQRGRTKGGTNPHFTSEKTSE
ncbi:hypothetical protein [Desulfoluna butyratoxydans]|uniref:Uncharacterized protein n=1 Tax=Desulfoluna butyratoxydans TaxID=231438 RepID=A0A4U8YXE7_9BACT|nr:hypothetical protein [Desulfoluna butyratoxydans]VFQ46123.1 hypothetical protein MSL71_37860 [Desulfoluna butyratoxydans]